MTTLTESAWQSRVIDAAILFGWRVAHIRPARTAKGWRTPYIGHVGLPDLILARDGRVIVAELKSDAGRPTLDQRAWLGAAGTCGFLWAPRDWPEVFATLSAGRPTAPPGDERPESARGCRRDPIGALRRSGGDAS